LTGISGAVPPFKFDSNGNVLANINAQSITPTATASNIKTDANGNVLANINAQNINPNIANPYTPQLLSHQTGLSYASSTFGVWNNIGSSITVPRNGIVKIILIGHTTSTGGTPTTSWQLTLTRGTTTYTVIDEHNNSQLSSTSNTSPTFISKYRYSNYGISYLVLELLCLASDVLQLQCAVQSSTTGATVTAYADDLVVMLQ